MPDADVASRIDTAPIPLTAPSETLSLEEMLRLGRQHLEGLVDDRGRTYFDVFLTSPPEAVFDWPDFVDLPARYWEAGAMTEDVLGAPVASMLRLRQWLFSHFKPDGLAHRPDSPISYPGAELFDQARLLYALVSYVMLRPDDEEVRTKLGRLCDGLKARATFEGEYAYIEKIGIYFGGTLVRPMLQAGIVLGREDLMDLAARLSRGLMLHSELITPAGEFSGHVHAALGAMAGAIACGLAVDDARLVARAMAGMRYARAFCTEFGFVPEHAPRTHTDDVVACETCSIMDYLDAAILIARHLDAGWWDVVEKTTRNHLWESQVRDASWLGSEGDNNEPDVVRRDLHAKVRGSFAGWSAPHCILANHECYWPGWIRSEEAKPRYYDKVRAIQNCCGGGGIRAVYQVWSQMVTRDGEKVSVNLSMDRETPDVRVVSRVPFEGAVRLEVKRGCELRYRVPGHAMYSMDLKVTMGGKEMPFSVSGPFLEFGRVEAGRVIEVEFGLPVREEEIVLGNTGHQMYRFRLTWRGDTVMSMEPEASNPRTAYVGRADKHMPSYYHAAEPLGAAGRLYRREAWRRGLRPEPARLSRREASADWYQFRV
jgi:hypothetical protein